MFGGCETATVGTERGRRLEEKRGKNEKNIKKICLPGVDTDASSGAQRIGSG